MLMAVEVAVSFQFEGWENMDSHLGESGAVTGFSDMMLEVQLRKTYCDSKRVLYEYEVRE